MKRRIFLSQAAVGGAALVSHACKEGTTKLPWGESDAGRTSGDAGTQADAGTAAYAGPVDDGKSVPVSETLSSDWRFLLDEPGDAFAPTLDDDAWSEVTLPHTPRVEALVMGRSSSGGSQWQGVCWYRRHLQVGPEAKDRRVFLHFDGAMNVAEVWLDGQLLGKNSGGYLPFAFDISELTKPGAEHVLAVKLNNRSSVVTGPKPLSQLDFNMYGGLYRCVRLVTKSRLYITDPIIADQTASGGVFVRYPRVSSASARIEAQVHIKNADSESRTFRLEFELLDLDGTTKAVASSKETTLKKGKAGAVTQNIEVDSPALWSPQEPNLYTLRVRVLVDNNELDVETVRIGIRRILLNSDGVEINGNSQYLRGTNRHQEYPYIGYALSDAAQYRDAKKIKDAGFDYVRLSHYPHSTAFMDACDELGLVVVDAILGWQSFRATDEFIENRLDACRRLVRRDRNHPCVILWEVSLNESEMPADFIRQAHDIAHAEYPGDQCYTAGWKPGYDVYLQARQHGGCRASSRLCIVSEYGDWEYYAQNAGLNQEDWDNLEADDANSRQLRWHGETALLQQARNFQEAHNSNLQTTALGDGLWVMFDYNRGYAPDIESSGCMDIMRLPKFSYYFFQSQRGPEERYEASNSGPMAFIASYWTASSPLDVRVFSNCEEVELLLNGELVERRTPDAGELSEALAHPPFTFFVAEFESGTLEAVGYIAGEEVTRHIVNTPGAIRSVALVVDESGRSFAKQSKDTVFIYAELTDASGTLVPDAWENVSFGTTGEAKLVGANPFSSDAGVSSILLQADEAKPKAVVYALALVRDDEGVHALAASVGVDAEASGYKVTVTTDGSVPEQSSDEYTEPVDAPRVRVALFVGAQRVTQADTDSELFAIKGSQAQ